MKAKEFVEAINKVKTNTIIKKTTPVYANSFSEIISLSNEFDLSKFEVYDFSFFGEIEEFDDVVLIGIENAANVVLNKATLEIEHRDAWTIDLVHDYCAANEGHLLNALAVLFKLSNERTPDTFNDIGRAKYEAYAATEAAGGDKYEKFYLSVTGYYYLLDDQD